ncbi:hypothetical protein, partial [Desulforhopalus singaporensis]|uniref:hypothetical protein n=1 Tax=Desulforhopalus singaporensis TaxID=91360 RepID=UPI001C40A59F
SSIKTIKRVHLPSGFMRRYPPTWVAGIVWNHRPGSVEYALSPKDPGTAQKPEKIAQKYVIFLI